MSEPTTSFPVLAPEPPRPTRNRKEARNLIATSVRIRIRMRLIINNLQFLNRESQISPISFA